MNQPNSTKSRSTRQDQDLTKKKEWSKPLFKNLRLGFEITMYFWTR